MMKRILALALALAMTLLLLAGCGGKNSPDTPAKEPGQQTTANTPPEIDTTGKTPKEEVTLMVRAAPNGFYPQSTGAYNGSTILIAGMIFDQLLKLEDDGSLSPELATKWEQLDELTWRFYLRDDVYFHNGDKLTAEDVVYTMQKGTTSSASASYQFIDAENTAAVDEYTVDIKLKTPTGAPFMYLLADGKGSILPKKVMEEMGDDAFNMNPVGSGWMKFAEDVSGDRTVLETNENYWGDKPSYKKLNIRYIAEASTHIVELETGGGDMSTYIDRTSVPTLEANPDTVVYQTPAWIAAQMTFNCAYNPNMTEAVRRGLAMAIDPASIALAIYGNSATGGDMTIPNIMYGNTGLMHVYDPDQAKQILDDCGFDYNYVVNVYVLSSGENVSIAEVVCNMWSKIGVQSKINALDYAGLSAALNGGDKPEIGVQIYTMSQTDGCMLGNYANQLSGTSLTFNTELHNMPDMEDLVDRLLSSTDDEKTLELQKEFIGNIRDRAIWVDLCHPDTLVAARSNVEGFTASPSTMPDLQHVTVWE